MKQRTIDMLGGAKNEAASETASEPFNVIEFELALDLQDPVQAGFGQAVRNAADVVGGELLFDMPADGSIEDASRIAAIRLPGASGDDIVFAALDEAGLSIRMASPKEIGDGFHGFARAFVGVLERLRDDRSLGDLRPEGSA